MKILSSILLLLFLQNFVMAFEMEIPTASEINKLVTPKNVDCDETQKVAITPVPKERLRECYQKFPSLMNLLFLVTDQDFLDQDKKQTRRLDFIRELDKDSDNFRKCSNDIFQYSKENNDEKNHKYFELRLSEVFKVFESL